MRNLLILTLILANCTSGISAPYYSRSGMSNTLRPIATRNGTLPTLEEIAAREVPDSPAVKRIGEILDLMSLDQVLSFLFVCDGNINRSAGMHMLLEEFIKNYELSKIGVLSGGTFYQDSISRASFFSGFGSVETDAGVMFQLSPSRKNRFKQNGINSDIVDAFQVQRFFIEHVELSDIIIVATQAHKNTILSSVPGAEGKVFLHNELLPIDHPQYAEDLPDENVFQHIRDTFAQSLFPLIARYALKQSSAGDTKLDEATVSDSTSLSTSQLPENALIMSHTVGENIDWFINMFTEYRNCYDEADLPIEDGILSSKGVELLEKASQLQGNMLAYELYVELNRVMEYFLNIPRMTKEEILEQFPQEYFKQIDIPSHFTDNIIPVFIKGCDNICLTCPMQQCVKMQCMPFPLVIMLARDYKSRIRETYFFEPLYYEDPCGALYADVMKIMDFKGFVTHGSINKNKALAKRNIERINSFKGLCESTDISIHPSDIDYYRLRAKGMDEGAITKEYVKRYMALIKLLKVPERRIFLKFMLTHEYQGASTLNEMRRILLKIREGLLERLEEEGISGVDSAVGDFDILSPRAYRALGGDVATQAEAWYEVIIENSFTDNITYVVDAHGQVQAMISPRCARPEDLRRSFSDEDMVQLVMDGYNDVGYVNLLFNVAACNGSRAARLLTLLNDFFRHSKKRKQEPGIEFQIADEVVGNNLPIPLNNSRSTITKVVASGLETRFRPVSLFNIFPKSSSAGESDAEKLAFVREKKNYDYFVRVFGSYLADDEILNGEGEKLLKQAKDSGGDIKAGELCDELYRVIKYFQEIPEKTREQILDEFPKKYFRKPDIPAQVLGQEICLNLVSGCGNGCPNCPTQHFSKNPKSMAYPVIIMLAKDPDLQKCINLNRFIYEPLLYEDPCGALFADAARLFDHSGVLITHGVIKKYRKLAKRNIQRINKFGALHINKVAISIAVGDNDYRRLKREGKNDEDIVECYRERFIELIDSLNIKGRTFGIKFMTWPRIESSEEILRLHGLSVALIDAISEVLNGRQEYIHYETPHFDFISRASYELLGDNIGAKTSAWNTALLGDSFGDGLFLYYIDVDGVLKLKMPPGYFTIDQLPDALEKDRDFATLARVCHASGQMHLLDGLTALSPDHAQNLPDLLSRYSSALGIRIVGLNLQSRDDIIEEIDAELMRLGLPVSVAPSAIPHAIRAGMVPEYADMPIRSIFPKSSSAGEDELKEAQLQYVQANLDWFIDVFEYYQESGLVNLRGTELLYRAGELKKENSIPAQSIRSLDRVIRYFREIPNMSRDEILEQFPQAYFNQIDLPMETIGGNDLAIVLVDGCPHLCAFCPYQLRGEVRKTMPFPLLIMLVKYYQDRVSLNLTNYENLLYEDICGALYYDVCKLFNDFGAITHGIIKGHETLMIENIKQLTGSDDDIAFDISVHPTDLNFIKLRNEGYTDSEIADNYVKEYLYLCQMISGSKIHLRYMGIPEYAKSPEAQAWRDIQREIIRRLEAELTGRDIAFFASRMNFYVYSDKGLAYVGERKADVRKSWKKIRRFRVSYKLPTFTLDPDANLNLFLPIMYELPSNLPDNYGPSDIAKRAIGSLNPFLDNGYEDLLDLVAKLRDPQVFRLQRHLSDYKSLKGPFSGFWHLRELARLETQVADLVIKYDLPVAVGDDRDYVEQMIATRKAPKCTLMRLRSIIKPSSAGRGLERDLMAASNLQARLRRMSESKMGELGILDK
ncbi:hypothetical protein ACFL0T_07905, partial [Candidatus Omnitrophota bacterium]